MLLSDRQNDLTRMFVHFCFSAYISVSFCVGNFDPCFCSPSDMLQLISNQEMEFGGLFDNPPYSGLTPTQELTALAQPITPAPSPKPKATPPSTSSIVSSTPHLDALLGPPITRSSSTLDKTFQSTTFQQSPLAQVAQKPASAQQTLGVRQTMIEQPQPSLSPPPAVQAQSPSHGSPGPKSFTPQALFTSPAPQSPPQAQLPTQIQTQTQTQIQTQPQPIQARPNQTFTGQSVSLLTDSFTDY